jgi:transcriptional regulator of arginine metabolism
MMKTKNERLTTIWNLVNDHSPSNQEELLKLLSSSGYVITQATLSRDIKELKIIKSPDANGNYIYATTGQNVYANRYRAKKGLLNVPFNGFLSLEFSDRLAVIKTRPGYAMGIASDIDQNVSDIILGTIAGDDTILLIPREGIEREKVKEVLTILLQLVKN